MPEGGWNTLEELEDSLSLINNNADPRVELYSVVTRTKSCSPLPSSRPREPGIAPFAIHAFVQRRCRVGKAHSSVASGFPATASRAMLVYTTSPACSAPESSLHVPLAS